jgi:hypothetical protein
LINEDNTIQGAGQIYNLSLTNRATIIANQTTELYINPNEVINSGTMKAISSGRLHLSGNFTNNGVIRADKSTVYLSTSTISGGTVEVVGTGEIRLDKSTISGGAITNSATGIIRSYAGVSQIGGIVTNPAGGQIIVNDNTTLTLGSSGTYTNSGTIAINSAGNYTFLQLSGGDVTLVGGGIVNLSNSSNNRIQGASGAERLINEDNTIQGSGQIYNLSLTNRATIIANQTTELYIHPNEVINSGTIKATSSGRLRLSGNLTNFDGATKGTVEVVGTGEIRLDKSTISGGAITNSATGIIRSYAGVSQIGGIVTNPAGGQIIVDDGTTLTLESSGTYTNSGTIAINGTVTYHYTYLQLSGGDVTLVGGGTVNLSNNSYNRIQGVVGTERLINETTQSRAQGRLSPS